MERIGLREAITALRAELTQSISDSEGEALRFEVGQAELEFQVEVERSAEGSSGIRFWVVDVGGKGSRTSSYVHTVRLPLKPMSSDGGPVLTGGARVPRASAPEIPAVGVTQ
jgi:hypothetical protein